MVLLLGYSKNYWGFQGYSPFHVGEAIAKCSTKVEKLEEAHQHELKVAEEKKSYKILIRLELEENRQILKKKVVR